MCDTPELEVPYTYMCAICGEEFIEHEDTFGRSVCRDCESKSPLLWSDD